MSPQITLKSLREDRLLSQNELAAQAGLTVTTISRIETGKVRASLKTIRALAGALNYEPLKLKRILNGEIVEAEAEPEEEAETKTVENNAVTEAPSQSKLSGIAKIGRSIWKRKP